MTKRLPSKPPKYLLRYPESWGEDVLYTFSEGSKLMGQLNLREGQGAIYPPQRRRHGASRAEKWRRYRAPWLFSQIHLSDLLPDIVLRVAPADKAGCYRVVERWLFRKDYHHQQQLDHLVKQFTYLLLRRRREAVFNLSSKAPG